MNLLPQQADPDSGPDEKLPVVWLFERGQELDQGGLAGTVGTDQSNPLAGANLERKVAEYRIANILPAKSVSGDEDHLVELLHLLYGHKVRAGFLSLGRNSRTPIPQYALVIVAIMVPKQQARRRASG